MILSQVAAVLHPNLLDMKTIQANSKFGATARHQYELLNIRLRMVRLIASSHTVFINVVVAATPMYILGVQDRRSRLSDFAEKLSGTS